MESASQNYAQQETKLNEFSHVPVLCKKMFSMAL